MWPMVIITMYAAQKFFLVKGGIVFYITDVKQVYLSYFSVAVAQLILY